MGEELELKQHAPQDFFNMFIEISPQSCKKQYRSRTKVPSAARERTEENIIFLLHEKVDTTRTRHDYTLATSVVARSTYMLRRAAFVT